MIAADEATLNELALKNLLSLLMSSYVEANYCFKQTKVENFEDYFKNERFLEIDIQGMQKSLKIFEDHLSKIQGNPTPLYLPVKQANMNIELKKLNQIYEKESFALQESQKQMKQFKFASNRNKARLKFEKEAISKSIAYIQHGHT